MACSGQVESHIPLVMEARNKMRAAEDTSLTRLERLQLLSDASDLIRDAIKQVGKQPNLVELLMESIMQFLKVE